MGLLRTIWQLSTVVVAGPATIVGLLALLDGRYPQAAMFLGLAAVVTVVSEYAYVRVAGGTVGRLARLNPFRNRSE